MAHFRRDRGDPVIEKILRIITAVSLAVIAACQVYQTYFGPMVVNLVGR